MNTYEICADEAWTHTGPPLNRYWCFFGGLFGLESCLDRLETSLRKVARTANYNLEVKWSNLSERDYDTYLLLVDTFFNHLSTDEIRYRQVFLDRSYVYVPKPGSSPLSDLDVQFRIYYQFLRHCFGLSFLPQASNGPDRIILRLDTHSSQKHKAKLVEFVQRFPGLMNRSDLEFFVKFHCSKQFYRIQICDVIVGAAGSYGNRMHDRRQPGKRGQTPIQKCRFQLAKHIYNRLRDLSRIDRGSLTFNWFETTGKDGELENIFRHKIRIWKFKPSNYHIDKGWENDNLDNQGRYVASNIIVPKTFPQNEEKLI